jgi:hypothetical protein
MDELDTWGDPIVDEGSQVLEASSPLVLVSHFDQQNEDSSLLVTSSLNRSDKVQNSKSQYDILPPSIQLQHLHDKVGQTINPLRRFDNFMLSLTNVVMVTHTATNVTNA